MQAYYRIQTRTPSGAIRCLTQPLNSNKTSFQQCLSNTKDNTQTFVIEQGKEGVLVQHSGKNDACNGAYVTCNLLRVADNAFVLLFPASLLTALEC
jgi:hypothetical protein